MKYDLICVIPVYNEAEILPKAIPLIVESLRAQLPVTKFLVVIADNGSTDATAEVSKQLEQQFAPFVKHDPVPKKGRGQAFLHVFGGPVKADRYLYIDADLPCELDDLERILAPLDNGADLVVSRRTGPRPAKRRLMTYGLHLLNRLFFGVNVADSPCAIKALSPSAVGVMLNDCNQQGWFLDTELVVLSQYRGLKVMEVPLTWIEQRFTGRASKVKVWKDSWECLKSLTQIWRRRRSLGIL